MPTVLAQVVAELQDCQQQVNCATDLGRWTLTADRMEEIVMAVATDPLDVFFSNQRRSLPGSRPGP